MNKRNKYAISKQDNEIRVISCDIAFVAGDQNDNSVYSCIRGIPESMTYESENNTVEVKQGYRRQYPYIESNQIGDTTLQAIRIRQLYDDFNADYIVLDVRMVVFRFFIHYKKFYMMKTEDWNILHYAA